MNVENWLFFWINQKLSHPILDRLLVPFSSLSVWLPLLIIGAVILVIKGGSRGRLAVAAVAVALLIGDTLISNTMKDTVGRARPGDVVAGSYSRHTALTEPAFLGLFQPVKIKQRTKARFNVRGSSFPSSHVVNNVAVVTVAVLVFGRLGYLLALPAFLVAWSRIYVGSHWVGDVLMAIPIGILAGWAGVGLCRWLVSLPGKIRPPLPAMRMRLPSPAVALSEADVSFVVPFYNEAELVVEVLNELRAAYPLAEIIAVDDGSSDATGAAMATVDGVRCLRFDRNRGQSAAVYAGLMQCSRAICATLDGDGQNDPSGFAKLIDEVASGRSDVACGHRQARRDSWSKRKASKIANRIRRSILDDGILDSGCAMRVFRREALQGLIPFNGLHRFLPAFFRQNGWRIAELPVGHRARLAGVSKYSNWRRAMVGISDLFGVAWLLRGVDARRDLALLSALEESAQVV